MKLLQLLRPGALTPPWASGMVRANASSAQVTSFQGDPTKPSTIQRTNRANRGCTLSPIVESTVGSKPIQRTEKTVLQSKDQLLETGWSAPRRHGISDLLVSGAGVCLV